MGWHSIVLGTPMVRAVLEGRKTQMREPLSPLNLRIWLSDTGGDGRYVSPGAKLFKAAMRASDDWQLAGGQLSWMSNNVRNPHDTKPTKWRGRLRYEPGDFLWVRERWRQAAGGVAYDSVRRTMRFEAKGILYLADRETDPGPWFPASYMSRWASRITLQVTDVRVERLQEISDSDCLAEGVARCDARTAWEIAIDGGWWPGALQRRFASYWEAVHGEGTWISNPYVMATCFRRVFR